MTKNTCFDRGKEGQLASEKTNTENERERMLYASNMSFHSISHWKHTADLLSSPGICY